jgi:F-type H+-transporting ATPase subunit epsilon
MGRYRRRFRCEVLTLEGPRLQREAVSAFFTASDGQVGILGGRSPLIAEVGAGSLVIEDAEGRREEYFVAGGFVQVREDVMTVMTDQCLALGEVDPVEAAEGIDRARKMPARTAEAVAIRDWALEVARARFNLAQKYRRRRREQAMAAPD